MKIKHILLFVDFYWIQIENLTTYRVQSVHWKYHIGLFVHQETNKQEPNKCYEKGKTFTVVIGWTDCELFPEGLILNLLLAGETFNSFHMNEIANFFLVRKHIINWTFLSEYKRRSEKYLTGITTKSVTK